MIDFRLHPQSVSSTRYTAANVGRIEDVLRRNVLAWTADEELAREWPRLADAIVNHAVIGEAEEPARAVAMIDRIRERFLAREPEARGDRDIERIYGTAQLRVASYLAQRDRGAALRAVRRAFGAAPGATSHALPRLAAFALLGTRAHSLRRLMR